MKLNSTRLSSFIPWFILIVLLLILLSVVYAMILPSTDLTLMILQFLGIMVTIVLFVWKISNDTSEKMAYTNSYKDIALDFVSKIPSVPSILSPSKGQGFDGLEIEKYHIFKDFLAKPIPDITIKDDWIIYKKNINEITKLHNSVIDDLVKTISLDFNASYIQPEPRYRDGSVGAREFGEGLVARIMEHWFYQERNGRTEFGTIRMEDTLLFINEGACLRFVDDPQKVEATIREIFNTGRTEDYRKLYMLYQDTNVIERRMKEQLSIIQKYPFI